MIDILIRAGTGYKNVQCRYGHLLIISKMFWMYFDTSSQLLHMSDDGNRADMADVVVVFGSDLITVESQAGHNVKKEGQEGWH